MRMALRGDSGIAVGTTPNTERPDPSRIQHEMFEIEQSTDSPNVFE